MSLSCFSVDLKGEKKISVILLLITIGCFNDYKEGLNVIALEQTSCKLGLNCIDSWTKHNRLNQKIRLSLCIISITMII